jgi:hypothetical protein
MEFDGIKIASIAFSIALFMPVLCIAGILIKQLCQPQVIQEKMEIEIVDDTDTLNESIIEIVVE